MRSRHRKSSLFAAVPLLLLLANGVSSPDGVSGPRRSGADEPAFADGRTPRSSASNPRNGACIQCHQGIEEIHPGHVLGCVDCHGGDDTATQKDKAHVLPKQALPGDERVLPEGFEPEWQRFRNPANLRAAKKVCGTCHDRACDNVLKSLHATTTGHLGDGYYENGLARGKRPAFGVFAARDEDGTVPDKALRAVTQVPAFAQGGSKDLIGTHYTDLARKACMQCHLWSTGRAVRGRVGMDGDYRGEGCAACHVPYAEDGRSHSNDRSIDKLEPGHPLQHRFTSRIPTDTCVRCHYGDASIGLSFRGMAQLVPGQPAGPEVPGTTGKLSNGTFYIQDRDLTPPDVHHQRGMHCIDCHTQNDVMGDGNLWPQMDHAVEIECQSCHGTPEKVSDLMTSKGRRVANLQREGEEFTLVSKVDGKKHRVVQAAHVVDPNRPEFNPRAAAAMTSAHGRLECYTCHSGWNVDFFGFHFDRNEQFTQLDLLSGRRTPGRVTTQEKVFATFNQLRLGFNHEGMVAPYMVGFSTIGSAHGPDGKTVLHQALPVTAAGLSGVTLVPHQTHTTRPEARGCVECHRSPATWGLGSVNFRLTREFAFAVTRQGLWTIALDAKTPSRTEAVVDLPLEGEPRALALRVDPATARSTHAYVGCADGSLTVVDVKNPVLPRLLGQHKKELADPHVMVAQGDWLYVADGTGGVLIYDLEKPEKPKLTGALPTVQARSLHLCWPWLLVADGPGGLVIADVSAPQRPVALARVDLNGGGPAPNEAFDVTALFQYSRTTALDPLGERIGRSRARHLAFVAAGLDGVCIVDFTEPSAPVLLLGREQQRMFGGERPDVRGVAINTQFDLGSQGGGIRSQEHDWLFVLADQGSDQIRQTHVSAYDVSDPVHPKRSQGNPRVYGGNGRLHLFRAYNAPFLQHFVVALGAGGLGHVCDSSRMATGLQDLTTWEDLQDVRDLCFEEMAFDRLQDERGRWEKDISHEDCRYLTRDEVLAVLRAPLERGPATPAATGPAASVTATDDMAKLVQQQFTAFDTDQDGVLTRKEFAGSDKQFAQMDKDKDGKVTMAEFAASEVAQRFAKAAYQNQKEPRARVAAESLTLQRLSWLFRFDPDHDGKVTRAEWTGTEQAFVTLDVDNNGVLDKQDLADAKAAAPPAPPPVPEYRGELPGPDELLKRLDRDGDGRISGREFDRCKELLPFLALFDENKDSALDRAELQKFHDFVQKRRAEQERNQKRPQPYAVPFDEWDKDKNGRIELNEWQGPRNVFDRIDQNRDAAVTRDEVARYVRRVTGTDFFSRFDLNGDGKVTSEEFSGPETAWLRADRNGDGVVNKADR
jgi:Ca2+-binding EF-hand superfamily protein